MRAFYLLRSTFYLSLAIAAGCSPPPDGPGADGGQAITGNERFGWDQPAADLTELGSFRFAVYLDGVRSAAADVTCGTTAGPAGFPCTCLLPAMPGGSHTLQVAAFIDEAGAVRESDRSATLRVQKR